jgi:uncharacterized protein DUF1501
MLSILGNSQRVCSGVTRRTVLQAGGAGLFGLSTARLRAAEEATGQFRNGRAKSVMFLFLFGGPSQLETFDMKPDAPSNLRGPFQPIASRTPDLRICEHMPRLAQLSDKFCVIRSMTHGHNDHNACHYMMTGHKWTRAAENGQDVNARETDWPSIGSVIEYLSTHEQSTRKRTFPDYVYLPNRLGHLQIPKYDRTGQYSGWLGSAYNGLATDIRPKNPKDNLYLHAASEEELDFRIKGLVPTTEISLDRLDRRRSLLEQFDGARESLAASARHQAYSSQREQAMELVTSDSIRTALDIHLESPALRDQYGRHLFGQSCLMGRRMIESGCRFVTVAWDSTAGTDGWDSHGTSSYLQKQLIPGFDQAFSALLTDLEQRGLLDETLVVAVGEMGRTPKPDTPAWGRGHWSYCFPAVLAGAGVRGGMLLGRSDKDAAWPVERPISPEDLGATIYQSLGVDPNLSLPDKQGRPVFIMDGGRPLDEIFS